ncbi:hypothetical protein K435DRAFT_866422 [Dendrothele bispora CBS 962.96]|uniref:Uncharacterized protein n=1 Tax=Dendrothele bispora (strain CBS 962.96) TaxID=1314807 RepID=A0A4S8LH04_DENBC|nr:hypothetical protein K435DRAFT_866422 [Dendrothele bispora CBS 962.96]
MSTLSVLLVLTESPVAVVATPEAGQEINTDNEQVSDQHRYTPAEARDSDVSSEEHDIDETEVLGERAHVVQKLIPSTQKQAPPSRPSSSHSVRSTTSAISEDDVAIPETDTTVSNASSAFNRHRQSIRARLPKRIPSVSLKTMKGHNTGLIATMEGLGIGVLASILGRRPAGLRVIRFSSITTNTYTSQLPDDKFYEIVAYAEDYLPEKAKNLYQSTQGKFGSEEEGHVAGFTDDMHPFSSTFMKEKKQSLNAKGRYLRSSRTPKSFADLPPLSRPLRPLNERRVAAHTNPQLQRNHPQDQPRDEGSPGIKSKAIRERERRSESGTRSLGREKTRSRSYQYLEVDENEVKRERRSESGTRSLGRERTRSRSYQYFEVDETGVKHVVECFRLDTTPDPDVYAVGSTLFSTTDGTLSACRVGPVTERIDCMPIKILVKYLAPDEVWMLIGTLGSDKPFAKFLTKDVYYDKEWEEFCVQASLVRLEFGEQVERRHRFRIVVSPSDRPGFLDAVQFECQPPGVEWKRDWECAYDEFKNLDNSHFLFDRD